MAEVQVICEVSEGLRPAEAHVGVKDVHGRKYFLPIDREMLSEVGDRFYLPVGLIGIDEKKKMALVEFPLEAYDGANRIWVWLRHLRQPIEAQ